MKPKKARWMLSFWHSEGDWRGEAGFPDVEFWHPDSKTARAAAARVLAELRDSGDMRDWVAAGHPDPREVAAGNHIGGQWALQYDDLECATGAAGERVVSIRRAADDWSGVDWEKMKRELHEARHCSCGARR